jgi:hypothetical protein
MLTKSRSITATGISRTEQESFGLVRWLYNRCCLSHERPRVLFDLATARLVERKVLLPGATVPARLIAKVRERAAKNLWSSLAGLATLPQKRRLEWLLEIPEDSRQSHLDRLRRGPVRSSGPALVETLERVEEIRRLGVGHIDLSPFPPGRIKTLSQYAARSKVAHIQQMQDNRRTSTLLAFAKTTELTAMDDVPWMFWIHSQTAYSRMREERGRKNACAPCGIWIARRLIYARPAR